MPILGRYHLGFLLRLYLTCCSMPLLILRKYHIPSVFKLYSKCCSMHLLLLGKSHFASPLGIHLMCCSLDLVISGKSHQSYICGSIWCAAAYVSCSWKDRISLFFWDLAQTAIACIFWSGERVISLLSLDTPFDALQNTFAYQRSVSSFAFEIPSVVAEYLWCSLESRTLLLSWIYLLWCNMHLVILGISHLHSVLWPQLSCRCMHLLILGMSHLGFFLDSLVDGLNHTFATVLKLRSASCSIILPIREISVCLLHKTYFMSCSMHLFLFRKSCHPFLMRLSYVQPHVLSRIRNS